MNMKAKIRSAIFLAALLVLTTFRAGRAGEPTEQIRAAVSQGVVILKNADLSDKEQRKQAIDQLRQVVYPLFDFTEMARRSLGSEWRRLDAQKQKEFVSVFTDLLEKTYAHKIDLYNGQKVVFAGETADQESAQVDTRLVDSKGQAFSVVYKMHRVNGKWKIYDLVVENISLVNNYRSQFRRVIVNSSFEELMEKMREKAS